MSSHKGRHIHFPPTIAWRLVVSSSSSLRRSDHLLCGLLNKVALTNLKSSFHWRPIPPCIQSQLRILVPLFQCMLLSSSYNFLFTIPWVEYSEKHLLICPFAVITHFFFMWSKKTSLNTRSVVVHVGKQQHDPVYHVLMSSDHKPISAAIIIIIFCTVLFPPPPIR